MYGNQNVALIKCTGLAFVSQPLLNKGLSVPVGEEYYGRKEPLPYRWINETENDAGDFQVYYKGQWQEAVSIDWEFNEAGKNSRDGNINTVPAKDTETLRSKVKDAVSNILGDHMIDDSKIVEIMYDVSDAIFEALGITEEEQDIKGAKVCINPKILITVRGGLAEACEYHPLDMKISIRDYDTEGNTEAELQQMNTGQNEFGDTYIERF